jgi:hypothetical protein
MLWSTLLLPWVSLVFMKKQSIKRYMPVAIFSALLVTIVFEMAHAFKWWEMKEAIVAWGYITNVSFTYGLFPLGTLWIFYFTFKKFWIYFMVNLIIDSIFTFGLNDWFERQGVYTLINFTEWHVFGVMTFLALIIYAYQLWQEGIFKPVHNDGKGIFNKEIELKGVRKKART